MHHVIWDGRGEHKSHFFLSSRTANYPIFVSVRRDIWDYGTFDVLGSSNKQVRSFSRAGLARLEGRRLYTNRSRARSTRNPQTADHGYAEQGPRPTQDPSDKDKDGPGVQGQDWTGN